MSVTRGRVRFLCNLDTSHMVMPHVTLCKTVHKLGNCTPISRVWCFISLKNLCLTLI